MLELKITQTGAEAVRAKVAGMAALADDLSPTWPAVEHTFREIETGQFSSEGSAGQSGKWQDLSAKYTEWKLKRFPGAKILERTGRLRDSLTDRTGDSFVRPERHRLTIGSKVEYGTFHQNQGGGRKWRPPISLKNRQVAQIVATINRFFVDAAKSFSGRR